MPFSISIINAYIWITYQSDFSLCGWLARECLARRHQRWFGCLPLWALAVHRISHAWLRVLLIKSCNIAMSMWIARISVTIFYLCLSYWPVLWKILGPLIIFFLNVNYWVATSIRDTIRIHSSFWFLLNIFLFRWKSY